MTIASVGISGTIAIGALVTWNGGSALEAAKSKIVAQAESMGIYKSNETKLITKANTLKNKIADLNAQIETLKATGGDQTAKIAELQTELSNTQTELDKTKADLVAAQSNGEKLGQAVDDLTAQLEQANADAAALQKTVDETNAEQSDQAAVDNALAEGATTETTPEAPEPQPDPVVTQPSFTANETIAMVTGVPDTIDVADVTFDVDSSQGLYVKNGLGTPITATDSNGKEYTFNGGYTVLGAPADYNGVYMTLHLPTGDYTVQFMNN